MIKFERDESTGKNIITVDRGIRYISDWKEFSLDLFSGPYIIDKKIPGCGFTEYCLTSKDDIILCSPRRILLRNKEMQHLSDVHYVRNELEFDPSVDIDSSKKTKGESIKEFKSADIEELLKLKERMKESLINYIHMRDSEKKPCKIIVTYDSFKHVCEFLEEFNILGQFKIVVDEFQAIMIDSRFKASTEFDFFIKLQELRNDICFVSATPMIDSYLSQLDYFKGLPFYELDWAKDDPGRVIKPELKVRKTKSLTSEAKRIIQEYLSGNFSILANPITGEAVQSKEAVFYLNSVGDIFKIVKMMKLKPSQVNILCSDNPVNRVKLKKKLGSSFDIGTVPLKGELHKMFTFCTRTVYLGADFYSTNARSFIFSDANIESLSVDISLDLPQILGRQRLIENPWKNHAEFYFKNLGVGKDVDPRKFEKHLEKKLSVTKGLLNNFFNEQDPETRESLLKKFRIDIYVSKYSDDYISLNYSKDGTFIPVFNNLVHISEQRAFDIQQIDYKDRFTVFNTIKSDAGVKLDKVTQFIDYLRDPGNGHISDRLKLLCETPDFTDEEKKMIAQQVSERFDQYFNLLGPDKCAQQGYNITYIKKVIEDLKISEDRVKTKLCLEIKVGDRKTKSDLKKIVSDVYESFGILKNPKATDILKYFEVKLCNVTDENGKRVKGFEILRIK